MEQLENMFLRAKPARILVSLRETKNNYASALSKEADCTYAHTVKLLDRFEKQGLVTFEKRGRKKLVELTDKGKHIADQMDALYSALNNQVT